MDLNFKFETEVYTDASGGWYWLIRDYEREYGSWIVDWRTGKPKVFGTKADVLADLARFMTLYLQEVNVTENLQPYSATYIAAPLSCPSDALAPALQVLKP